MLVEHRQLTTLYYDHLTELIEPGRTERELQVELEAAFFRGGAARTAYDSIVAGGPNAAVLHFPPTARPLGSALRLGLALAHIRSVGGGTPHPAR